MKKLSSASLPSNDSPLLQVQSIMIDQDQAGQRLDNFLMARLKGVPKSRVYNIIRKGEVRVNKGRSRPDYKLADADVVRIPPIRMAEKKEVTAQPSHSLIK